MATDLTFKVAPRRREAITFSIDGSQHVYTFQPPKQAALVMPVIDASDDLEAARATFAWLDQGLSEEDQDHLAARLRDPEDDLDTNVLEDIVESLVERVSGRPTT